MSGSSNNRNQEESSSHHGYEVAVHSPDDAAAGLAINHPEPEPEEEHSANNRWSRCSTFSLTLTTFIFILAAVCVVVGIVAWSAVSPASSKAINVTSKQVAVALAGPFDDYEEFGDGYCLDKEGKEYPELLLLILLYMIRKAVLKSVNALDEFLASNSEDFIIILFMVYCAGAIWIG